MKIRIKIKKNGTIEAKTEDVTGKKCLHIVPMLDELFEARMLNYELQDDFYKGESVNELTEKVEVEDFEQEKTKTLSKCNTGV